MFAKQAADQDTAGMLLILDECHVPATVMRSMRTVGALVA